LFMLEEPKGSFEQEFAHDAVGNLEA
jgi:hypothetical protein